MRTSQLNEVMRQRDPELLNAVQHLATGKTEEGVRLLREQGRVTEVKDGSERIAVTSRDPRTLSSSRPIIAAGRQSTKPSARSSTLPAHWQTTPASSTL